jgi:molybdenum cofactor cytidylyltransferase
VNICGILLAAGASTRFGSDKLLYPLGDGRSVAVTALANLRAAIPQVIAVVRPGVPVLEHRLSEAGATVVVCADADQGMGTSLAMAVSVSGATGGWVIALGDMPYVQPQTITKTAAALAAGAPIVAPCYHGERGHPVGFSARFRRELEALRGDEGARALLKQYAHMLQLFDVDDPGVRRDIDTPADLVSKD